VCREGVSDQSIGSGSVETTFDAVLVLQGFGGEPFEKIRLRVRRRVPLGTGCGRRSCRRRWRRGRRWPGL
jgi:hypothetical protein